MPTMAPSTRADAIAERELAIKRLGEWITPETVIHTRTDYTRSQTDYVRVYIVGTDYDGRPEIRDITYYVARANERRMTDRGIAYRGGNYSKGLEAFMDCARQADVTPDQHRWREIH